MTRSFVITTTDGRRIETHPEALLLSVSPALTEFGLAREAARVLRVPERDVIDKVFPLPPRLRRKREKRRVSFADVG